MLIEGYSELKKNSILHRDLKPENIFLSSNNLETAVVKLADFGLSKEVDPNMDFTETILGTPLYAAPEIFSQTVIYDYKVDVWALGIILYELLFGFNPFQAEDVATLTMKHM